MRELVALLVVRGASGLRADRVESPCWLAGDKDGLDNAGRTDSGEDGTEDALAAGGLEPGVTAWSVRDERDGSGCASSRPGTILHWPSEWDWLWIAPMCL